MTLAHGLKMAGTYALTRDGRDDDGIALASGIYLYRLEAGDAFEVTGQLLPIQ